MPITSGDCWGWDSLLSNEIIGVYRFYLDVLRLPDHTLSHCRCLNFFILLAHLKTSTILPMHWCWKKQCMLPYFLSWMNWLRQYVTRRRIMLTFQCFLALMGRLYVISCIICYLCIIMLLVTERHIGPCPYLSKIKYWPMSLCLKPDFFVNESHSIIISQNHSKTLTLVVWEMVIEILFEKHAVLESPSWLITWFINLLYCVAIFNSFDFWSFIPFMLWYS